MSQKKCDVLVVGGGPAGSSVAALMSTYGKSVVLIEKEEFPRYHVGESLLSGTADLIKKIGAFEEMEKQNFVKKHGVDWLWGNDGEAWTVYFKDALAMKYDYGYQVERDVFDDILLKNARKKGTEILQPYRVKKILEENGRVVGVVAEHTATKEIKEIYAEMTVDASGASCLLSKKYNTPEYDENLQNMAIWSYWEGEERPSGIDAGNTYLTTFKEGWWWFIPLKDKVSVGIIIDKNNYDQIQKYGPKDYYLKALEESPQMMERLKNAQMVDKVRTEKDWSYKFDKFYGPGFIALGQAACFIDPLFSTGVHLAILSGYLGAVAINTILDKDEYKEEEILAFYQEKYEAEYNRLREQVNFLYSGHKVDKDSYFWNARKLFDLPNVDPKNAFVSLIAGAYEHRSWYSRYLKNLDVPEHLKELLEGRFNKDYIEEDIKIDAPLNLTKTWNVIDDFAVDGNYVRDAKSIKASCGKILPYDNLYKQIIENINGKQSYQDILNSKELAVYGTDKVESCLVNCITYGIAK